MKIAFVRTTSNILKLGAYNIQEIGLANSLLKYGISVDIYSRFSNVINDTIISKYKNNIVTLKPLKGKRIFKEIMYYPQLKNDLCNNNYDIVQLLDDSQIMLPFLFKSLKKNGIKTILWQGMYRNFSGKIALIMQLIYDLFFISTLNRYSDIKIAKTYFAKEYLQKKGYENIVTLPVGLDKIKYECDDDLSKKIKDFKKKYPNILLYVGRVERRRNIDFIIDLLKECDQRVGLILVGNGSDDRKLSKRINKLNLLDRILRFKNVSNKHLISVYENSDIFLLPTSYEIYGMVILESLYFGIPIISTKEAGPVFILQNDILGCCLEKLDKTEWIHKIDFYLKNNKNTQHIDLRKKEVENKYRWSNIAEKYYTIIQKL
jgi:glycosyltransferase involved in cell wall biosynthesis